MRASARSCEGESDSGGASAARAPSTVRRSPRRFALYGATSCSARAGVEP
jgi:hypothetical protein